MASVRTLYIVCCQIFCVPTRGLQELSWGPGSFNRLMAYTTRANVNSVYRLCVENVSELKKRLLVVWYGMELIINRAVITSSPFHKVV